MMKQWQLYLILGHVWLVAVSLGNLWALLPAAIHLIIAFAKIKDDA